MTLFNFNKKSDLSKWYIVNDTVMGGISSATINISDNGKGLFKGHVSLENNGGFAMVQYKFDSIKVDSFSKVVLRLKGDGQTYQFRIKANKDDKHAYIFAFETNSDWQTIEVPFSSMFPAYRGKKLNLENFPGQQMALVAFLIGNKKESNFKLCIDSIDLK